eukprot:TRINITY_DN31160_c0_g1_i1.p1 TRINITY_DN31160_c0_g1~~TRINITY_DN31160_c0_g1_i1.p1  ORF type:complete len:328 (+),score=62.39 TRINITY_DN31160_c0_g1_i1:67-984(+)
MASGGPNMEGSFKEIDDFTKELDAEMLVDLDRLRQASKDGIPVEKRRAVWKYLLSVTSVDKSEELTANRKKEEEFEAYRSVAKEGRLQKNLMRKLQTLYPVLARDSDERDQFNSVLLVFLCSHASIVESLDPIGEDSWATAAIHILLQFSSVMKQTVDIYQGFSSFMDRLYRHTDYLTHVRDSVATLSMLFRYTQPALYRSFELEEVDSNEWALEWVSSLLAGKLETPDLVRLWDGYLVDLRVAASLHVYVCLALLQSHSEKLMELERTGMLELLNKLPPCPIDKIVNLAFSIREDVQARGLLPD